MLDATNGRRVSSSLLVDPERLRWWMLLAAWFAALALISIRVVIGGGAWFAQAVDVYAGPAVLVAALLAIPLRGVGDIAVLLIDRFTRVRASFLICAVLAGALLAAGTLVIVGTTPIAADELVPIFQARVFARFDLVAQFDRVVLNGAVPLVSQGIFVLVSPQGEALSVYMPGMAILLVPFVWLGVPWLVGPVFGGLAIYLIGRLAATLIGMRGALMALILTAASGQFLLMAMTPFPDAVHLTLTAAFFWLLSQPKGRNLLLAGLVGGLALAIKNPLPHFLVAAPWVVWLALDRERRRGLVPLAIGYVPGLAVIAGWLALQNSLTPPAFSDDGGFWVSKLGELIQVPTTFSLSLRFVELLTAWSWSAPGLLVLAFVGWRTATDHRLRLMGISLTLLFASYLFFPDQQGLGYGARYIHPAWAAIPILAAAALVRLWSTPVVRYTFAAALIGVVLCLPVQAYYATLLRERREAPMDALAGPGADLYFVRFRGPLGVSETVLANDYAGSRSLVYVSQGPSRDQLVIDLLYPGARLVKANEWGASYDRP